MTLVRRKPEGEPWETVLDTGSGDPTGQVTAEADPPAIALTVQGTTGQGRDDFSQLETIKNLEGDELVYIDSSGSTFILLPAAGASFSVDSPASNTGSPFFTISKDNVVKLQVNKDGKVVVNEIMSAEYAVVRGTSAPADADIAAGEVALWFDATNGSAKLKIKGKSANGTVVAGEVALT